MSITSNEIESDLITYLKRGNPILNKIKKIPLDESLVKLEYIDSFGIVDIVSYLEKKWKIKIKNEEINQKNFSSINKMVKLVTEKLKDVR